MSHKYNFPTLTAFFVRYRHGQSVSNRCWSQCTLRHQPKSCQTNSGQITQKVMCNKNNGELPLSRIHPIHCTNWSRFLPCTSFSALSFSILNQKASGLYWGEIGTTLKHWVILSKQPLVNSCKDTHTNTPAHKHTHTHTHKHTHTHTHRIQTVTPLQFSAVL